MMRPALWLVVFIGLASPVASLAAGPAAADEPRLKLRNDFESPEQVVRYYCTRDAAGFVFSGMLEGEVRAFTTWREAPRHDAFYISNRYQVSPARKPAGAAPGDADTAFVDVTYELAAISDAHGTESPCDPFRKVTFTLKRVRGRWKIVSPAPHALPPVLSSNSRP